MAIEPLTNREPYANLLLLTPLERAHFLDFQVKHPDCVLGFELVLGALGTTILARCYMHDIGEDITDITNW